MTKEEVETLPRKYLEFFRLIKDRGRNNPLSVREGLSLYNGNCPKGEQVDKRGLRLLKEELNNHYHIPVGFSTNPLPGKGGYYIAQTQKEYEDTDKEITEKIKGLSDYKREFGRAFIEYGGSQGRIL